MNPCDKHRRALALLAAGDADAEEAEALKRHVAECSGCRQYFHAISGLAQNLQAASELPRIEPSPGFHRDLVARLRTEPKRSWWSNIGSAILERATVKFQFATAVAILILALGVYIPLSRRPEPNIRAGSTVVLTENPPPTLITLERLANQSEAALDRFLDTQAAQPAIPEPLFSSSTLVALGGGN